MSGVIRKVTCPDSSLRFPESSLPAENILTVLPGLGASCSIPCNSRGPIFHLVLLQQGGKQQRLAKPCKEGAAPRFNKREAEGTSRNRCYRVLSFGEKKQALLESVESEKKRHTPAMPLQQETKTVPEDGGHSSQIALGS